MIAVASGLINLLHQPDCNSNRMVDAGIVAQVDRRRAFMDPCRFRLGRDETRILGHQWRVDGEMAISVYVEGRWLGFDLDQTWPLWASTRSVVEFAALAIRLSVGRRVSSEGSLGLAFSCRHGAFSAR